MPDTTELEQFSEEFFQDILSESENGGWREDIFFDKFTDYLTDAGEFNEAIRASYQPASGQLRVDGYCGDPLESGSTGGSDEPLTLGLIVLDFHQSGDLATLGTRDMNAIFNRLMRYLNSALQPSVAPFAGDLRSGIRPCRFNRDAMEPDNQDSSVLVDKQGAQQSSRR